MLYFSIPYYSCKRFMYQNFSYRTCHEKYERDSNKVKTSLCKDKEISNETLI